MQEILKVHVSMITRLLLKAALYVVHSVKHVIFCGYMTFQGLSKEHVSEGVIYMKNCIERPQIPIVPFETTYGAIHGIM